MSDKRSLSVVSSRSVFKARNFELFEEQIVLPNGRATDRAILRHPGAAVIVPQTSEGSFLLVRQFRHALNSDLLEFPAGTLEKGEQPLECAKREICEEVGHQADEWISLGHLYPAPGFCDEIQHCYLARKLSPFTAAADLDEILDPVELSQAEVENAICCGELIDAKSIAVFTLAKLRGFLK